MMTDNNHPMDLLAPYALHAMPDGDESASVERHLKECPRCRQELDAMRDVAAALGNVSAPAPEQLWLRISSRLGQPGLTEVPLEASRDAYEPRVRPRSHRRRQVRAMASLCTIAALAIGLMVVALVRSNDRNDALQRALGDPGRAAVTAALIAPGHRIVELTGPTGSHEAELVLLPSGQGYLVNSEMPRAPSGHGYELWAFVAGRPIPVALMGASPKESAFTMASSPRPSAIAITLEQSSGSLQPTSAPLASASV